MFSALRTVASKQIARPGVRRYSSDLSRVTLIGRLGYEPVARVTSSGKPYYTYSVATAVGSREYDENGVQQADPPTSWHTIFAFNEASHRMLSGLGKGSTVYVEAELEMRPAGNASDGTPLPDRPLLRHQRILVLNRRLQSDSVNEVGASDEN